MSQWLLLTLYSLLLIYSKSILTHNSRNVHNVNLFINRSHLHIIPFEIPKSDNETSILSKNSSVLDHFAECIQNHKDRFPHLANRFNDYVLARACGRFKLWLENVSPAKIISGQSMNITLPQQTYVQRIRNCHSHHDCFPDTSKKNKTHSKRQSGTRAIRRECRTKSKEDLRRFFAALNKLKTNKIDSMSKYDLIVFNHLPQSAPSAHFGPSFLPYHRELLRQIEVAVRDEDPQVSFCYWDSTLDHDLPNPADSVLWTPELLGNGRGYVTTGPFANWHTTASIPEVPQNRLFRNVGGTNGAALYNADDIERFMTKINFEDLCCYCRDPSFEILHGGVHDFVGGHMTYLASSPNDPVFFMHHTFIDQIWELWRQSRQTPEQRQTDYPANARSCGTQYYGNSPMLPFPMKNKDGLRNSYESLYVYAASPTCENGGCRGDFLFCNTDTNRCMSKVRSGGDCTNLDSFDSCFNSQCIDNRCTSGQNVVRNGAGDNELDGDVENGENVTDA